mmetsp:Transcript_74557/g.199420  ORF Transcript_74557/g.199420 Transcript_74557/m.199420 type:complete len:85 (-) Transcript_74557:85-339(-)
MQSAFLRDSIVALVKSINKWEALKFTCSRSIIWLLLGSNTNPLLRLQTGRTVAEVCIQARAALMSKIQAGPTIARRAGVIWFGE